MLTYAMLCYTILCYANLCYAMLCCALDVPVRQRRAVAHVGSMSVTESYYIKPRVEALRRGYAVCVCVCVCVCVLLTGCVY
jgi:hypothetical protein